jgi:hypothetical protein
MPYRVLYAGFIAGVCGQNPPGLASGALWLHEIKHDGFRVIARKKGALVRPGNDLTYRFPLIVKTLAPRRSRSCITEPRCRASAVRRGSWWRPTAGTQNSFFGSGRAPLEPRAPIEPIRRVDVCFSNRPPGVKRLDRFGAARVYGPRDRVQRRTSSAHSEIRRMHPAHARSSGSETSLRSRSLAGLHHRYARI